MSTIKMKLYKLCCFSNIVGSYDYTLKETGGMAIEAWNKRIQKEKK